MSRDCCPDRVSRVNGNAFPLVTRYSLTRHFFVPRPFAHVTLSFVTRHSSLYPFLTHSPPARRRRQSPLLSTRARQRKEHDLVSISPSDARDGAPVSGCRTPPPPY